MPLNILGNADLDLSWTNFKSTAITAKSLPVQYYDDGTVYNIWAFDGGNSYTTIIYKGTVPDAVVAAGYSQSQNDSDKTDFTTNYQPTANKNAAAAIKQANTAAVAADPAMVVAISPNNTVQVSITPQASGTGLVFGQANTGGSAGTLTTLRATTYTEQTSNAQRSVKSTSTSDTSAGTGARQITITYYTSTMTGPFTETITLNGTTAVNTTNTNICFIEKMVVTSVGSTGSNQGTISIFTTTGGGGSAFGSIGVSNVVTAGTVGDNRTLWSHHYVASSKNCYVTTISCGTNGNQSGVAFLRSIDPTTSTSVDTQITEAIVTVAAAGSGSVFRVAGVALKVTGPARITQYAVSGGTNTVFYGGFEYSES